MEATGCATAGAICTCAPAQNPRERAQVLAAYGLQDLRNNHPDPKTKSNPNTMCLQITLGENHGSGHFYLAKPGHFYFALTCSGWAVGVDCVWEAEMDQEGAEKQDDEGEDAAFGASGASRQPIGAVIGGVEVMAHTD